MGYDGQAGSKEPADMQVNKLLVMHDTPPPTPGDMPVMMQWYKAVCDADDRFYAGLVLLIAESAPFAWSGFPDPDDSVEIFKVHAWLVLVQSLPAGRRAELALLLRETGYERIAVQVPA
jgi:hypothetical protein